MVSTMLMKVECILLHHLQILINKHTQTFIY